MLSGQGQMLRIQDSGRGRRPRGRDMETAQQRMNPWTLLYDLGFAKQIDAVSADGGLGFVEN